MRSIFYLVFSCLFFPCSLLAIQEGQFGITLGGGHSGLLQDVGANAGNSVGESIGFIYAATDEMVFDVNILNSNHNFGINHQNISAGLDVYLSSYDLMSFFIGGGVNSLKNHFSQQYNVTSTGFGVYLKSGVDFLVIPSILVGITAQYTKAFETEATFGSERHYAIQDSVSVLARVGFLFGVKK